MIAPTTLEIDLGAIAANWRALAAAHPGEVGGVVKADAYGLGAAKAAPVLAAAGCRTFFAAHLAEALALRALLPGARIVVLHGVREAEIAIALAHDLLPVLGSAAEIAAWRGTGRKAALHVDTGMNRLGLPPADLAAGAADGLNLEFVMTHLVSSEVPDATINAQQLARFAAVRARFPGVPGSLPNSSGLFLGADFCSDLGRPGAALYGINPTPGRANPMRPVVRLRASVIALRTIGPGETVGYNQTWTAARPSRIATVAVGYADGYPRSASNRAVACFDGVSVPLVGRVSMDLTTFDVTDCPGIALGAELDLIGPANGADALAAAAGTNGYEILTGLGARYRRVYRTA